MSFTSFKSLTNQALVALALIMVMVLAPSNVITVQAQNRNSNQTLPNRVQTLTQTTLSAAVTPASMSNTITVASNSGFTVGYVAVVITGGMVEAMDITAVNSTVISVARGVRGTSRYAHNSGDVVFVQRPALFNTDNGVPGPKEACSSVTTSTGATAVTTSTTAPTPWVSLPSGNVFYCVGGTTGQWVQTLSNGFAVGDAGGTHSFAYTAAGALFTVPGLHTIGTSGALAMTIAPPTKDMDGVIMVIVASTAQAHTLTYTAGFSQSTTSSDVATFGGAVNDGLVIVADAGVWRVISTRNVTIA